MAMEEPTVLMPVTCPECGTASLCRLSVSSSVQALRAGHAIKLQTECHARTWHADFRERQRLREYLGDVLRVDQWAIGQTEPRFENEPWAGGYIPIYSVLCHASESSETARSP